MPRSTCCCTHCILCRLGNLRLFSVWWFKSTDCAQDTWWFESQVEVFIPRFLPIWCCILIGRSRDTGCKSGPEHTKSHSDRTGALLAHLLVALPLVPLLPKLSAHPFVVLLTSTPSPPTIDPSSRVLATKTPSPHSLGHLQVHLSLQCHPKSLAWFLASFISPELSAFPPWSSRWQSNLPHLTLFQ